MGIYRRCYRCTSGPMGGQAQSPQTALEGEGDQCPVTDSLFWMYILSYNSGINYTIHPFKMQCISVYLQMYVPLHVQSTLKCVHYLKRKRLTL